MLDDNKTALISRNITINKRRTSIRLEAQMWIALKDIAKREKCSIHDICGVIASRKSVNITLTAAIRVFLMLYFKAATTEDGHKRAGHGGLNLMMSRVANQHHQTYDDDDVTLPASTGKNKI
jgi:predicted DNA-binding ribbon-helix-helix protein